MVFTNSPINFSAAGDRVSFLAAAVYFTQPHHFADDTYHLPYHGNRFFAVALNDALPMSSLQVQILHIHFG